MTSQKQQGFVDAHAANASQIPVVRSIFDFSAEALGELKTWLEQNPPSLAITSLLGYSQLTQTVRVKTSANTSIANTTFTLLGFDTEDYDKPDNTIHDTATNNSRLTVQVPGRYLPVAAIQFAASAAGSVRIARVKKNGVSDVSSNVPPAGAGQATALLCSFPPYDLVKGDYMEVEVFQDSGGALNVLAGAVFTLTRVG